MKNSELIEFLKTQPFTRTQAYNLLTSDMMEVLPHLDLDNPNDLRTIQYLGYKVKENLLVVISELRGLPYSV